MKKSLYNILGPEPHSRFGKFVSATLTAVIVLNVFALILGTVQGIHDLSPTAFFAIEVASVAIFTVEYILRLWASTADPGFSRPYSGRIRYMTSPLMLIDLLAILPFYVALVIPVPLDLRILRSVRLAFRIARSSRHLAGVSILARVIQAKRRELVSVVAVLSMLLVLTSSLVYFAENGVQPEVFSSIPETMWWGIITLTTIGYGDAYPITMAGRALTGVMAVMGIGLFALPAGILGSGFIHEVESTRECPNCGFKRSD